MKKIVEEINEFRKKRTWQAYDTARNLATSISIEANELLENYQWSDIAQDEQNVKEEIADVLIYTFTLCDHLNLDPETLIREKLIKNAIRYPETKK